MKAKKNHHSSDHHSNHSMDGWISFLRWFCPTDLYEGIEGDLLEQYEEDVSIAGEKIAKRRFVRNTMRFFRPGIILRNRFSTSLKSTNMFRNNLKIASRNILKNKVHSLITIVGLVTGMVATALIGYFVWFESSYERQYTHAENIYRVTLEMYDKGNLIGKDAETYRPTGPTLKLRMPEVVDFVRFHLRGIRQISNHDLTFYEDNVYAADASAFKIFNYHFLSGSPEKALENPFEAVITKTTALKYFKSIDVAGQTLWYGNDRLPMKIVGVIDDLPVNTHLKFNFLFSIESLKQMGGAQEFQSWSGNNDYTYLLLSPHIDLKAFNRKLKQFSKEVIQEEVFVAAPIQDIHLKSHIPFEPEANGNEGVVLALLVISIVIIVIAWINYINLSTARAIERAKEVGIRKVVGSTRSLLVSQFMTESFLFNLVAVGLAVLFFKLLFLPFCQWAGIDADLNVFLTLKFVGALLVAIILSAVIAGFYPAIVLSSFQPATVLKGRFGHSSHGNTLRKSMVVFQFIISMILITGSVTAFYQVEFMRKLDLGISVKQKIAVNSSFIGNNGDSLARVYLSELKNKLSAQSVISDITIADAIPGQGFNELSSTNGIALLGEQLHKHEFYFYTVDANYIETMGLHLLAGRNFSENSSNRNNVIVNEESLRLLGIASAEEAIGRKITRYRKEGVPAEIIGVVKNFYFNSPKESHIPLFWEYREGGQFLTITIDDRNRKESLALIQKAWKETFPDRPFSYFFLDDQYEKQFRSDERFGEVFGTFSVLAILIGCLGLFGLSSYTLIHRTKEIGIRKVLGASVSQLFTLLSSQYVKLSLLAGVIAIPLSYALFTSWLNTYPIHITLSWWILIVPLLLLTGLTITTVAIQTLKASMANPVNSLKYE